MEKITKEFVDKAVTPMMIAAEVSSDYNRIMEERANLANDYTYSRARMSDEEFKNRKFRKFAGKKDGEDTWGEVNNGNGIPMWFGWSGSYSSIVIARVLNKTGYNTTASDIRMLISIAEDKDDILSRINGDIRASLETCLQ